MNDIGTVYDEVRKYLPNFLVSRMIVAHEIGKKHGTPHYHIWIETEANPANVRNCLNNNCPAFKALKRSEKCVQVWGTLEDDLTYFCKGDDIRETRGFTPSQIDCLHDASTQYVEVKKKMRRSGSSTIDDVLEMCQESNASCWRDIVRCYVEHCKIRRRPFNKHNCRSVCLTVEMLLMDDDYTEAIIDSVSRD